MSNAQTFNDQADDSGITWDDILLHVFILIPIEFGILHSTPLGPLLTGFFNDIWLDLGFEFAAETAHAATEAGVGLGDCHFHGTELHCGGH